MVGTPTSARGISRGFDDTLPIDLSAFRDLHAFTPLPARKRTDWRPYRGDGSGRGNRERDGVGSRSSRSGVALESLCWYAVFFPPRHLRTVDGVPNARGLDAWISRSARCWSFGR